VLICAGRTIPSHCWHRLLLSLFFEEVEHTLESIRTGNAAESDESPITRFQNGGPGLLYAVEEKLRGWDKRDFLMVMVYFVVNCQWGK